MADFELDARLVAVEIDQVGSDAELGQFVEFFGRAATERYHSLAVVPEVDEEGVVSAFLARELFGMLGLTRRDGEIGPASFPRVEPRSHLTSGRRRARA